MAKSWAAPRTRNCSFGNGTGTSLTGFPLRRVSTFSGPHIRGKGGAGSRIFNVIANGAPLLRNFEIFKAAGERRAIEKVFHGLVPNAQGRIEVSFEPVVQYAAVNGLELIAEK